MADLLPVYEKTREYGLIWEGHTVPLTPTQAAGLAARTHVVVPVEAFKAAIGFSASNGSLYIEFADGARAAEAFDALEPLLAAAQKEG